MPCRQAIAMPRRQAQAHEIQDDNFNFPVMQFLQEIKTSCGIAKQTLLDPNHHTHSAIHPLDLHTIFLLCSS